MLAQTRWRAALAALLAPALAACSTWGWERQRDQAARAPGGAEAHLVQRAWKETQSPTHGEWFSNTYFLAEAVVRAPGAQWQLERAMDMGEPREVAQAIRGRTFELAWTADAQALLLSPDRGAHWVVAYAAPEAPFLDRRWMVPQQPAGTPALAWLRPVIDADLGLPSSAVPSPLQCDGPDCFELNQDPIWKALEHTGLADDASLGPAIFAYAAKELAQLGRYEEALPALRRAMAAAPALRQQALQSLSKGAPAADAALASALLVQSEPQPVFDGALRALAAEPASHPAAYSEWVSYALLAWSAARAAPHVAAVGSEQLTQLRKAISAHAGDQPKLASLFLVQALGELPGEPAAAALTELSRPAPEVVERLKRGYVQVDRSASVHFPSGEALPSIPSEMSTELHDWAAAALARRAK